MITINKIMNGVELNIDKIHKQENIQWAKDILANYAHIIPEYNSIINDDEQLVAYAELLEEKNLSDNGDREIEAIEELFGVLEE